MRSPIFTALILAGLLLAPPTPAAGTRSHRGFRIEQLAERITSDMDRAPRYVTEVPTSPGPESRRLIGRPRRTHGTCPTVEPL